MNDGKKPVLDYAGPPERPRLPFIIGTTLAALVNLLLIASGVFLFLSHQVIGYLSGIFMVAMGILRIVTTVLDYRRRRP